MYTLTVKIAASGTIYLDQSKENPVPDPSDYGHMWYTISNGTSHNDYGFAPETHGKSGGPGAIKDDDSKAYQDEYYTGTIVITAQQYNKLKSFGKNPDKAPYNFSKNYKGLSHNCIDFVWKALEISGFNPGASDGQFLPTFNADNVDKIFYESLLGNTADWDESKPDGGNYRVVYGSRKGDNLVISELKTQTKSRPEIIFNSIYTGDGDDTIELNTKAVSSLAQKLLLIDGGEGDDTLKVTPQNDTLDLTNAEIKEIEQVEMGGGNDTVKAPTSASGPEKYYGGDDN
ncbi:MAG: hypothetical protein CSA19_02240, partial [Deltaproteobacteria bacterium]